RGHRERYAPALSATPPLAPGSPQGAAEGGRGGRRLRFRAVVLRLQAPSGARAVAASDHHGRRPPQEVVGRGRASRWALRPAAAGAPAASLGAARCARDRPARVPARPDRPPPRRIPGAGPGEPARAEPVGVPAGEPRRLRGLPAASPACDGAGVSRVPARRPRDRGRHQREPDLPRQLQERLPRLLRRSEIHGTGLHERGAPPGAPPRLRRARAASARGEYPADEPPLHPPPHTPPTPPPSDPPPLHPTPP